MTFARWKLRKTPFALIAIAIVALAAAKGPPDEDREVLLKARESVWRAWFAGDLATLEKMVPEGTIVISSGEEKWKSREDVMRTAKEFHRNGGRLLRLEFPRTEIQRFGNVAIIYSRYSLETEMKQKRSIESGRVTETFVKQKGSWTNPGWHTDAEK